MLYYEHVCGGWDGRNREQLSNFWRPVLLVSPRTAEVHPPEMAVPRGSI